VRLRNLGGTIVVDFVDLPTRPERQRLEEALRKAFRADTAPLEIHAMSYLGIVTMSRARRGQSLASRFLAPCARCGGGGVEPSSRATAERVLAAIRSARGIVGRIRMPPAVEALLATSAAWRNSVQHLGYEPVLVADGGLGPAAFVLEEGRHG
jgi:Ribonuclease G/E